MFLKSIELFGFKSFAERSTLQFSPGITALLGPNGCGKSNIVDGIKWVLGEQSMKPLRAGRMEDVIFNGTENRKKLSVAEVVLTISNERGYLPLDVPEIAIKRRMYRSGESEYFINNAPVRLREVRELFYDTGIGKSAYSILEQGKIDQILSQRPEDRRYIFEEAAGITRFKQRHLEAERKLERTAENIRQVEGILKEVKQTYDSRRLQAQRAEKYRGLDKRIFEIEVDLQLARVQTLERRLGEKQELLECALEEIESLTDGEDELQRVIDREMDAMNRLSRERIDIQTQLHRMDESKNSRRSQMELLTERIADFDRSAAESLRRIEVVEERARRASAALEEKQTRCRTVEAEYAQTQKDRLICEQTISAAAERIEGTGKESRSARERIDELEQQQVELGRRLQEITESIARELDAQLKAAGYSAGERVSMEKKILHELESLTVTARGRAAVLQDAAALRSRQLAAAAADAAADLSSLEERIAGVTARVKEYFAMIPGFIDDFLSPAGIMTKKRQIDREMEETYRQQAVYRGKIDELAAEREQLEKRLADYRQTLEESRIAEVRQKGELSALTQEIRDISAKQKEDSRELESERLRLEEAKQRRTQTMEKIEELKAATQEKGHQEQELKERVSAIQKELDRRSRELEAQRKALKQREQSHLDAGQRIERARAEIASAKEEISYIHASFEENFSRSLSEFRSSDGAAASVDQQQLRSELKQLRQQAASLGYINHMAAEEYAEVKERYEFLHRQLTDLKQAREDLLSVTKEITARSEVLFEESYAKIKKNFHSMFRRLFGGGRAELRLVDPDDLLNTGIDILAQPPGKKLEKISLLSGGERSMTAVALLFATYLVKPSPFCILDEIDAALDDANIGFFLDILSEFSENSQFIIITHNKKTVLGSASMLGVTMQEPGVSKVIAYRLGEQTQE